MIGNEISAKLRLVNQQQIASFLRTVLQVSSFTSGWVQNDQMISGLSFVIFGAITLWGLWARNDQNLIVSAASVPAVTQIKAVASVAADTPSSKVVSAHGLLALMLVPFLLTLGACASTGIVSPVDASTPVSVRVPSTKVDVIIAKYSPEVAKYCTTIKIALTAAPLLVHDGKALALVRQAEAGVNAYCAAPPTNAGTALAALSQIWFDVQSLRAAQQI